MNSREKASFWIEHGIKHGGKHLRSVAMDMHTYQFLMIDVIALVLINSTLVSYFVDVYFCLQYLNDTFQEFRQNRKQNEKAIDCTVV